MNEIKYFSEINFENPIHEKIINPHINIKKGKVITYKIYTLHIVYKY